MSEHPDLRHTRVIGELTYRVFQLHGKDRFAILVRNAGHQTGGAWMMAPNSKVPHRIRTRRKWRKLSTACKFLDDLQGQMERRQARLEERLDSAEAREETG